MNRAAFFIVLLLTATAALAQPASETGLPYPYEVGVSVGRSQYFGDLYKPGPLVSSGSNWGDYAFVRRRINATFALRGNLLLGRLTARDRDNKLGLLNYRSLKFTTPLVELAGLAELYPLRHSATRRVAPYFFAGVGGLYKNPAVTKEEGGTVQPSDSALTLDRQRTRKLALVFPVGVGLTYALTPHLKAGLELGYRFSTSDYIDGFRDASYGYSKHKDSYLTASVLVVYRLPDRNAPPPDADNDGVIDDLCPDEFGDPATCGCPDDDQDGIPNACDCCPNEKGERAFHGCPKAHNVEYDHARPPAPLRYCPLCPPDLRSAHRLPKPSPLIDKTRQPTR